MYKRCVFWYEGYCIICEINIRLDSRTSYSKPRRVEGIPWFVSDVALGSAHALALCKPHGRVFSWGRNASGCLGLGGEDARLVVVPTEILFFRQLRAASIAAGSDHSLIVCTRISIMAYVTYIVSHIVVVVGVVDLSFVHHASSPYRINVSSWWRLSMVSLVSWYIYKYAYSSAASASRPISIALVATPLVN